MNMRRTWIVAIAFVFALMSIAAGCSSQTASNSDSAKETPQKETVLHGAWAYDVPPKSHFNVFSTGALTMPGSPYTALMTSPLALYYWHNNSWEKQLATDWSSNKDDMTFTVKLRQDVKWSDGTTLNADDVSTYLWIARAKNYTVWRYIDSFEKLDDYTIKFKLKTISPITEYYILRIMPQPRSVYGEWAQKFGQLFQQGKDEKSDEMKELLKEFDAFRPDDYVASGPFKMDTKNITEAQLTLVKRQDAWNADNVKIDKIVIYNGETAQATPLVLDKKIDFVTHAFPPATEQQFINMGLRIIRFPYYTGPAIFFNNDIYPFNRVEFRQALAYAIDRQQVGTVALAKSGVAVKYMSGISDNLIHVWMKDDDIAKLNTYDYNVAKAEEILKSIGFEKKNDQWYDDHGKKLEFEFMVPSDFADWSAAADNVAQQLTSFGIKIAVRGVVWSQYTTEMQKGNFQMGFLPWGSSTPHPQFAYLAAVVNYNAGGKSGDKEMPGQNWPLVQTYSGGEINFDELITELGTGDMEYQKNITKQLAFAFNELLPIIPMFERYSNAPILDGVNVTGWPPDGDPLLTNGSADSFLTPLIVTGRLRGVDR